eukprot:TRINITY_DN9491_c0_g2_i1.p1 TRINITY_DN9491_c0_g2~~TRINITY_DN9491_c0_g2_i1.p1  ORF type:complete len:161 (+),score=36.35 TRINITY_DN9491_c0_g2_i1:692-1174(+)
MCEYCNHLEIFTSFAYTHSISRFISQSLEELLYNSTSSHDLDRYKCPSCECLRKCKNTTSFGCMPRILIFHIMEVDMKIWFDEIFVINKAVLMNIGKKEEIKYRLYGIVNYYGNSVHGHYTAFVRYGEVWWSIDDLLMEKVACLLNKNIRPFMLFYEKIE